MISWIVIFLFGVGDVGGPLISVEMLQGTPDQCDSSIHLLEARSPEKALEWKRRGLRLGCSQLLVPNE